MQWLEQTWTDLHRLDRSRTVVILPVGAIEAHGPHLPLGTDGIISQAMAQAAARQLKSHDLQALVLPTLDTTVAGFAQAFTGTISFSPSTVIAILGDLTQSLSRQGYPLLAIANSHLDPGHLATLRQALRDSPISIAYPDLTRRRWASLLTPEFQSGACHAGQYEGSIILAARPDLVKQEVAHDLPDNPASLVTAIRLGKTDFHEADGPQAYFGSPRSATVEEGQATIETLGSILLTAILEARAASD